MKDTVINIFLRYLREENIKVIFGIPGGLIHPLFESVEKEDDFKLIISRHEQGAAFMADGYARASVGNKMAVCAGISGPGATNMMTGVACAFADGIPMLVITGQVSSNAFGIGAIQEAAREGVDIVGMFKPITKYSAMVTAPENMPKHFRRAMRLALSGRPGPVHLNVPVDFWAKEISEEWFDTSTYQPTNKIVDLTSLAPIVGALQKAKHPVIFVGSGAAQARNEVLTLAEMLPARVVTSPKGKGLFPEDHPLSLGVFGLAGHTEAKETLLNQDVDVLLVVGSSLNETASLNWNPGLINPNRTLIHIDIDPDRIGRNYPANLSMVGDASESLWHIINELSFEFKSLWGEEVPLKVGDDKYLSPELRTLEISPLSPPQWRVEFQKAIPDNSIIFSDAGGHMLWNIHDLCIKKDQTFLINMTLGSMGHGTVAPIGASFVEPSRPIFAIVGDACFAMNGMELITAAEYNVPVIWIVENNNMQGMTYHASKQLTADKQPLKSSLYKNPINIAAIAQAMGLLAIKVDQPIQVQSAIKFALEQKRPTVIEMMVDPMISPPLGGRASTLAGFFNNAKK